MKEKFDFNEKKEQLKKHLEAYWEKRFADETDIQHLKKNHPKWIALFDQLLANERFVILAEPVTDKTNVRTSEYYMRYDGVSLFPESLLCDKEGEELIFANPMRFPYDSEIDKIIDYRCPKEELMFDVPMRSVTSVENDLGKKCHVAQMEEMERIRLNQERSKYPIETFHYMSLLSEASYYRRKELVFYFPMERAMDFMYSDVEFEPIVKGVNWLMEKSNDQPFSKFTNKITWEDLGATGSASFGDEDDLEDFDIAVIGSLQLLREFRDFLINGTRHGTFRPYMSHAKRRLRAVNRQIYIALIDKHLLFCPFLLPKDTVKDTPLYRAYVEPIRRIGYFEAKVSDDSLNMVCPSVLKINEICELRGDDKIDLPEEMEIYIVHGGSRGQYYNDNWLRIYNAVLCNITPPGGKTFQAFLSLGWADMDLASW